LAEEKHQCLDDQRTQRLGLDLFREKLADTKVATIALEVLAMNI
jgi:hypothetical protein